MQQLIDTRSVSVSEDDEPTRFRRMEQAFSEALARDRAVVRDASYVFAGRPVRMRVLGAELAARTHRAFGHLSGRHDAACPRPLQIDVWDESQARLSQVGEASTDLDRGWVACGGMLTASREGRYVSFRYGDSVTIFDRHGQRIIACRRKGSHLSGGEYSKPLLLMLSIWYHDHGVQLLHSGLIAHEGCGVLLQGESGTGKSTTSISAFEQGFEFLGDDFIGAERRDSDFLGHSIFNTACVVSDSLSRFPAIRQHAVETTSPEDEKPILFLSEIRPERVRRTVPIRAVALLRTRQERTHVLPARPADAMMQIAASTLHTVVPRPGRDALQLISDLLARVPAYWLLLGPDLGDLRGGIQEIVADATRSNGS
jgi:hypothetical protein